VKLKNAAEIQGLHAALFEGKYNGKYKSNPNARLYKLGFG